METQRIYNILKNEYKTVEDNLKDIDRELSLHDDRNSKIVIKSINGKRYYYEQWREGKKLISKYVGAVKPGKAYQFEQQIIKRKKLLEDKKEQEKLLAHLENTLKALKKQIDSKPKLQNYSFEVFWKNEITARVHVEGSRVKISRYISHPLKQIFASDKMSRYQLNQILEMRCIERGRPDINEWLSNIGLVEYNPYEIVRRTHGVSYNDYIWFRFEGENLTCEDVLVR